MICDAVGLDLMVLGLRPARASRRPGGACGVPGSPRRYCAPELVHVDWYHRQVFNGAGVEAA